MASRHCVLTKSMRLYMTNRCLPGAYSKAIHPRLSWSTQHLSFKNTLSLCPAIVRSEKHSTLQFSTRYTVPGGSKPSSAISARDDTIHSNAILQNCSVRMSSLDGRDRQ